MSAKGSGPEKEKKSSSSSTVSFSWVTADSRYTEVLNQYVPEADRAAAAQIDREEADAGEPEFSAGPKEA